MANLGQNKGLLLTGAKKVGTMGKPYFYRGRSHMSNKRGQTGQTKDNARQTQPNSGQTRDKRRHTQPTFFQKKEPHEQERWANRAKTAKQGKRSQTGPETWQTWDTTRQEPKKARV